MLRDEVDIVAENGHRLELHAGQVVRQGMASMPQSASDTPPWEQPRQATLACHVRHGLREALLDKIAQLVNNGNRADQRHHLGCEGSLPGIILRLDLAEGLVVHGLPQGRLPSGLALRQFKGLAGDLELVGGGLPMCFAAIDANNDRKKAVDVTCATVGLEETRGHLIGQPSDGCPEVVRNTALRAYFVGVDLLRRSVQLRTGCPRSEYNTTSEHFGEVHISETLPRPQSAACPTLAQEVLREFGICSTEPVLPPDVHQFLGRGAFSICKLNERQVSNLVDPDTYGLLLRRNYLLGERLP
mmetsp:Transcript_95116/g.273865  ORF Transcript_95116/g.273865 Transcript_95116/m.273865 type:complete len:300 (-) Transcript_95116:107-1006(-)